MGFRGGGRRVSTGVTLADMFIPSHSFVAQVVAQVCVTKSSVGTILARFEKQLRQNKRRLQCVTVTSRFAYHSYGAEGEIRHHLQ